MMDEMQTEPVYSTNYHPFQEPDQKLNTLTYDRILGDIISPVRWMFSPIRRRIPQRKPQRIEQRCNITMRKAKGHGAIHVPFVYCR